MPKLNRLAILDDYQGVALPVAPGTGCRRSWRSRCSATPSPIRDALAARLAPFDAILMMRERTAFLRPLIERLPNLRLLITTGGRNRSIDLDACAERGVTVCGTPSFAHPTVDLTWGLILSLMRRIPEQEAALRAGRWQVALGN